MALLTLLRGARRRLARHDRSAFPLLRDGRRARALRGSGGPTCSRSASSSSSTARSARCRPRPSSSTATTRGRWAGDPRRLRGRARRREPGDRGARTSACARPATRPRSASGARSTTRPSRSPSSPRAGRCCRATASCASAPATCTPRACASGTSCLTHDRVALAQSWPPEPDAPEVERRYVRADGSIGWFLWRHSLIRDAAGQPDHWVSQGVDITARKRDAERLDHQAHHDPLTKLPNRARFDAAARRRARPRPRRGRGLRRHRRLQGHQRLARAPHGRRAARRGRRAPRRRAAARRRARPLRRRRVRDPARAPRRASTDARRIADRLAAALKEPFELGGHERFLTASFGIAFGNGRARRGPAARRRRRDVPGQGPGQGAPGGLRRLAARPRAGAAGARGRAARRDRLRASSSSSTSPRSGSRTARLYRHGGAAALAAPGARDDLPRALHPDRRAERPDRADRRVGAQHGLPPGRRVARRGPPGLRDGRQPLARASSPARPRRASSTTPCASAACPPSALCLEITESAIMEDPEAAQARAAGA